MDLFGKKAAKEKEELQKKYEGLQQTSLSLQKRNQELQSLLTDCQQKLDSLGYSEYEQIRAEIKTKLPLYVKKPKMK